MLKTDSTRPLDPIGSGFCSDFMKTCLRHNQFNKARWRALHVSSKCANLSPVAGKKECVTTRVRVLGCSVARLFASWKDGRWFFASQPRLMLCGAEIDHPCCEVRRRQFFE